MKNTSPLVLSYVYDKCIEKIGPFVDPVGARETEWGPVGPYRASEPVKKKTVMDKRHQWPSRIRYDTGLVVESFRVL
jgi:hypothetical protein